MSERVAIGILGGSGLYEIENLDVIEERDVETPFGKPSAPLVIGEMKGRRVAFIPRHGTGHRYNPSEVPYRANIWAMKQAGVFWLVSVNAVGSLRKEIAPGDFCIPDNIIDKTYRRANTLYDEIAVHVNLGRPFHPMLREVLLDATRAEGIEVHDGGTYVCMEGPAFSTVAESNMHRQWGASLIGMTAMPEARLAREAEMCYASISLPTDYDVWYEQDHVDINEVFRIFGQNIANVKKVLARVIETIPLEAEAECDASKALEFAIITKPDAIGDWSRENLALTLGKYL
jgi:5'-methylthioadenosine phosphorylase